MTTFFIVEAARYRVEADGPQEAVNRFLEGPINRFPCEVTARHVEDAIGLYQVGVDVDGSHE